MGKMAFIKYFPIEKSKTSSNGNGCYKIIFLKNNTIHMNKVAIHRSCKLDKAQKNIQHEEEKDVVTTVSFIKEITTEMKMIEWPSVDRLFKQFVIVVISLVFSAIFIYSVDGVFASLSKLLFEGN